MDTASKTWQHSVAKVLSKKQGGERTMTAKTARVYTLDELKEKCQGALADPKLVEIVKTAPQNKSGKVNLTWVYKQAEEYVHGQTKDLQKTKELAVATRFLAMLRRDFAEEFEKLIAQRERSTEEIKTGVPKKLFHEIEFKFPSENICNIELITREGGSGHNIALERSIRFCSDVSNDRRGPREMGTTFCMKILDALVETADPPGDMVLMKDLVQLLEEKFGLKIKICMNCNNCQEIPETKPYHCDDRGDCSVALGNSHRFVYKIDFCEHWTPKEVSEKPSSA